MSEKKNRNIITLTTDMGLSDYYVGAIKGGILKALPEAVIVDISHQIKPFRIEHAVHVLKNCRKEFPEGTIHIVGVDTEPLVNFKNSKNSIFPTIVKFDKQYFIGADNGFFSLLLEGEKPEGIWRLDDVLSDPKVMSFPTKNIFVPAACRIAKGDSLDDFCTAVKDYRKALALSPVLVGDTLRGSVTYIDHYGNLITNISKEFFEKIGKKAPFTIYFRKKEYYIDVISTGYNEVPHGEKLALFNDSGFLEIAINKGTPENGGGANTLLGLKIGDIIRIEFFPKGSRETLESLF